MHDPPLVRRHEPRPRREQRLDPAAPLEVARLGQPAREIGPVHKFHREVGPLPVVADVVDGDDVRMVELGERPGLPHHPAPASSVAGSLGPVTVDELERDLPTEVRVEGGVDRPARPAADELQDHVAAHRRARGQHVGPTVVLVFEQGSGLVSSHEATTLVGPGHSGSRSLARESKRLAPAGPTARTDCKPEATPGQRRSYAA